MKTGVVILVAAVTLALGGAGGYWYAHRAAATPDSAEKTSAKQASAASGAGKERKLLYYRNPMGLPDTSPVPKKDPMGMDYVPVYEGEDSAPSSGNELRIAVDRVQKLGVRAEPAAIRDLSSKVQASGRVEIDERRVFGVTPRYEGYVESLHVNATGQPVAKGQPLFEMYSPELVSVQREYAIAMQAVKSLQAAGPEAQAPMQRIAEASLQRLRAFDVSEEQIRAIADGAPVRRTLTFRSPVGGVILEKKAVQGMRFMPGDMLYQIADLSAVWVIADLNEQDVGQVRTGTTGTVKINAYPDRNFNGRVTYIYPTLKAETRTIPVRFELANPGNVLKPGMYAQVELASIGRNKVLTVPGSAVIDSGTRRMVLVQRGEGRFEAREVALGYRAGDYVEVVKGVKEGEPVVTSANFLIDAESNLRAAVTTFTVPAGAGPGPALDAAAGPSVGHYAEGTVDSIDAKTGAISIAHGPVASLKWPAMTMEFVPANSGLVSNLKPGEAVAFEFVERKPGEWVITKITPRNATAGSAPAAPAQPAAHAGH